MIDMEDEREKIFKDVYSRFRNLTNYYEIHYRKELMVKYIEANYSVRKELCEHYLLHTEFINRIIRDPGFKIYVRRNITFDEIFKKKVRDFLNKIILNIVDYNPNIFFVPNIHSEPVKQVNYTFDEEFIEEALSDEMTKSPEETNRISEEKNINYLQSELEKAMNSSDIDNYLIIAIESLIDEHYNEVLFGPDKLFPLVADGDHPYQSGNDNFNFYHSNLRFATVDKILSSNDLSGVLFPFIFPDYYTFIDELFKVIHEVLDDIKNLSGINHTKIDCIKAIFSGSIASRMTYINMISNVVEEIWLNSRTLKEGFRIYNSHFPIELTKDEIIEGIDNFLKINSSYNWTYIQMAIADRLLKIGLHKEAIEIFQILSESNKDIISYRAVAEIAKCYYEIEQYQDSIKYYKIAFKGLKRFPLDNNYIGHKSCQGIALFLIGKEKLAINNMRKIEKLIDELNNEEKIASLFIITMFYRTIGLFDEEWRILNRIRTEADSVDNPILLLAQQRLINDMNNCISLKDGRLIYSRLEKIEKERRKNEYYDYAVNHFRNYQFELSCSFLEKALTLFPKDIDIIDGLLNNYMLLDNKKEMNRMVKYIKNNDIDMHFFIFYEVIIYLLDGNINKAKSTLKSAIKLLFEEQYIFDYHKIFKKIIPEFLYTKSLNEFEEIFINLIDELDTSKFFTMFLTNNLLFFGRFDDVKFYLKKSMEKHPNDGDLTLILADCYYKERKYHAAIDQYKILSTLKPNSRSYYRMSKSYLQTGNVSKARECINKAIALDDNDEYINYNNYLDMIWNTKLNIKKVTDQDVQKMMRSSEANIVIALSNESDLYDYSPIILGNTRAVERILHDKITRHCINKISKMKYEGGLRKMINAYRPSSTFIILPFVFRDILLNSRSIVLGSWIIITETIMNNSTSDNQVANDVIHCMSDSLTEEQLEVIHELCSLMRPDRGDAGHIGVIEKDRAMNFRDAVTAKMNEFISLFY